MDRESSSLRVSGVSKSYGSADKPISVLKGLDLEVPSGSFLTLMGPSGSGKSTLLHLLSAIDSADSGKINVFGEEITEMDERGLTEYRRKTIGIVFQFFHLLPYLRAWQNVAIPLYLQGVKESEAKRMSSEALERVGLKDRIQHKPHELSGGEQQRVAIARSIVHKPRLILADEPTGNLDSKTSDEILAIFRSLVKELSLTLFMVTHNPDIGSQGTINLKMLDGKILNT